MNALLQALAEYGWWIAGLALLVLEVALPGVYLLFFAIAALIVGTNAFFLESSGWFGWDQQVIAFVVLSIVCILIGRQWYGTKTRSEAPERLNRRTEALIGREAVLSDAIVNGRGRVAVDDSWWSVSGPDTSEGARVRIVGAKGSVLLVEPVSS